jgi:hypothetical protein
MTVTGWHYLINKIIRIVRFLIKLFSAHILDKYVLIYLGFKKVFVCPESYDILSDY